MAQRFTVEAIFKAIDRISAPVSRMQTRVRKFTASARRNFRRLGRGVDTFGRGLRRVATAGVVSLVLMSGAMANVISTGAQFEQTLVTAAVKFPGEIRKGTAAFEELQNAAAEVGRTTEFTASQSAEALNFLAMAGFDAKTSMAALPGVVDLATVANLDLGRATDIATDSMGAFQLLSKDAATNTKNLARVSDLLTATSTRANTTVEDMFEALKQGAPLTTAAGQSIETTAAFIATMANAGIKGTKAGTGLKNIMLAIGAPGSMAAKVFKRLGVNVADASGNIRDGVDIFADFGKAVNDLPNSQKLQAFNAIFGRIPIAAAINIANAAEETRKFRDDLLDINGVTKEMAKVMRDTFQGRMKALTSAIEAVKIRIFGLSEGPLSGLLDQLIIWVRLNEEVIATDIAGFIVKLVNNFDRLVTSAKRVAIAVTVFLALAVVLKSLIAILVVIDLLLAANLFTLVVVGVIALVAAITALVFASDELMAVMTKLPKPLKVLLFPLFMLAKMASDIKKNWEPIKEFFASLFADLDIGFKLMMRGFAILRDAPLGILRRLLRGRGVAGEEFDPNDPATRAALESTRNAGVISKEERISRSVMTIRERGPEIEDRGAIVTIVDETGRARSNTVFDKIKGLRLLASGDFLN